MLVCFIQYKRSLYKTFNRNSIWNNNLFRHYIFTFTGINKCLWKKRQAIVTSMVYLRWSRNILKNCLLSHVLRLIEEEQHCKFHKCKTTLDLRGNWWHCVLLTKTFNLMSRSFSRAFLIYASFRLLVAISVRWWI